MGGVCRPITSRQMEAHIPLFKYLKGVNQANTSLTKKILTPALTNAASPGLKAQLRVWRMAPQGELPLACSHPFLDKDLSCLG